MNKSVPVQTTPIKCGVYKHSKSGTLYELLGEGIHSETLEELVRYRAVGTVGETLEWLRPKQMWFESVLVCGQWVPRFQWSLEHNRRG